MLIDTHAHLTFPEYDKDREDVIKRAKEAGLINIINIGSGLGVEDNKASLELSKKHPEIYSTVGFHPHNATEILSPRPPPFPCGEKWRAKGGGDPFEVIKELAGDPKVVAVGEIGLDYHYIANDKGSYEKKKKDQVECFARLIQIANEARLPLIVHDRDAHDDTLFTLRNNHATNWGGVMHCFSGSTVLAKRVLDLGYYISITGAVTFKKKAEELQDVVKYVPIERLLIETDAPYIAPEPYRGKRNEPAYVIEVAKKIAELKGLSLEDVGRITTLNAKRLFHLPGEEPIGKIAYAIRKSLYLNITNRCSLACSFCPKRSGSFEVKGHNLKLQREPDVEDVFKVIGDITGFEEVVFCGFGEPTLRLELIKVIAKSMKEKGMKVRIDTDGLGNLVHGRNILPELKGLVDAVSVSLNAHDAKTYQKICPSQYKEKAFDGVCEFIKDVKKYIPEVTATVVSLDEVDISKAKKLAEEILGVKFKARVYQEVG